MMYYKDHNPPHFHAKYEGEIAVFNININKIVAGDLPPHAKKLVREWVKFHKAELLDDWERARKDRKLKKISPLL